jgi:hypothetical protein
MKINELIGLIRESIGNVLLKEDMELSWAEDRRDRDDWNEKNLHSGDMGSQAHALFKHLRDEGDIDESYDVYDIIPMGDHFDMTLFAVKDDLDTQWIVGTEYQTHESAVDSLKDMIDGDNVKNYFSTDFILGSVNIGQFNRYLRELLDDMIYQDPEGWLSDEDRELTDKQEDFIKYLNIKKERLEKTLENADQDNQDEIQDQITEVEEKISEIESDPQGEYSEGAIENKIDEMYRLYEGDPESFFSDHYGEYDADVLERHGLIDMRELIEEAVNVDGPEHFLSGYDGKSDSVYYNPDYYTIIRYS